MNEPPGLPPLREVIARHDLGARKGLGQHFLLDSNLTGRIARAAGPLEGRTVIEIGPGPGGLTRSILTAGAPLVLAVEVDPRCIAALRELSDAYPDRLRIVRADALKLDLLNATAPPRKIVANLPYNIATPLLVSWIARAEGFESLTLMFQKEVADRLLAPPRSKDYGRLSVLVQWLCEVRRLFDVPPRAFVPPPRVVSTVVRLVPRPSPIAEADLAALSAVTKAAFGQRRKMLRGSLRSLPADTGALIAGAGLRPESRAEELTVSEFCTLARTLRASATGPIEAP